MAKHRYLLTATVVTGFLSLLAQQGMTQVFVTTDFPKTPKPTESTSLQDHKFVGTWITKDGRIRHNLLPNGRYDEARGKRESAYQGRYKVTGNIIQYWDDTGFYADGEFKNDVLYHAGMILYRQPSN